ncbi:hypothetical protein MAR_028611, partial [Mya arenaria]
AVVIYQVDVLFREPQLSVRENETFRLQPARRLVDHNLEVSHSIRNGSKCLNSLQCTAIGRSGVNVTRVTGPVAGTSKCSDPCPTTPGPVRVTDKTGKVVEVLAGGYHPIGRKPNLPPLVIRKVRYAIKGTHIVLVCPTSKNSKVRWQRGERAINPRTIRRQTKGRVYLDRLNRLHIWKLRERDSAPYNCWVWKRHTATIKVLVYEGMDHNLKHYITYGGLVL